MHGQDLRGPRVTLQAQLARLVAESTVLPRLGPHGAEPAHEPRHPEPLAERRAVQELAEVQEVGHPALAVDVGEQALLDAEPRQHAPVGLDEAEPDPVLGDPRRRSDQRCQPPSSSSRATISSAARPTIDVARAVLKSGVRVGSRTARRTCSTSVASADSKTLASLWSAVGIPILRRAFCISRACSFVRVRTATWPAPTRWPSICRFGGEKARDLGGDEPRKVLVELSLGVRPGALLARDKEDLEGARARGECDPVTLRFRLHGVERDLGEDERRTARVAEERVHRADERGVGPVIGRERVAFAFCVADGGEIGENVGASEGVNALLRITDDDERAVPVEEGPEDPELHGVGVLELVDEHRAKLLAERARQGLAAGARQDPIDREQEILEPVHPTCGLAQRHLATHVVDGAAF